MALEQPFTHWPFSASKNGRQGSQSSQRPDDRFKRYDTNDSPFKGISPIGAGREFGTFPYHDRQPRNVVREEVTQRLNIRASQGFLSPDELEPDNQFLPIPEDAGIPRDIRVHHAEPPFAQDHPTHRVHADPVVEQEPIRGLSLMDRYRDANQETLPVRRTNSLLEFADFIGRVSEPPINRPEKNSRHRAPPQHSPSPQQRRRQQPVMTEQQSLKRNGVPKQQQQQHQQQQTHHPLQNGNSRRQPNGGLIDGQQYNSGRRQPNGGLIDGQQYNSGRRQPNGGLKVNQPNGLPQRNGIPQQRPVPTLIPSYPTAQPISHQPQDDYPYLPRKQRRRRRKDKKRNILCCGIGMVITGLLVLCGFIAAFVSITIINKAWPDSGLLLAGVVFGLLVTIVGLIFACHRCYSVDYDDDFLPGPAMEDKVEGLHPVWQTSLPRSGLEAMPMTDLPLVQDEFTSLPLRERDEILAPGEGDLGQGRLNGSSPPVANGIPTPLAFTTPFSTTANDYGLY